MTITLTLAQINPTVGDINGNLSVIRERWARAEGDLIAFPELCISGYPPDDLLLKPSFLDAVDAAVKTLVTESKQHDTAILISVPHRKNQRLYSAAHLIHDGAIIGSTYKHILPNYGVFDERRHFSRGDLPVPIVFKGHTLGVLICEDLWKPVPAKALKDQGAEQIIVLNASPYTVKKHDQRIKIAQSRATETGLPIAYVNQWGGHDDILFDGGSFFMDANGAVITQAAFFEDQCLIKSAEKPALHHSSSETIYKALVTGTRDYIRKNGFSQVVLGLSGGIDSALVACIAADAVGADNVLAVLLPSQYTSEASNNDALTLAETLGIQTDTIAIEDMHTAANHAVRNYKDESGLTDQNMQSRLRGMTLMAISNAMGRLLLSTGNKSEMAVGYATLYGDMNGAYNPLKDVYKTRVYDIAKSCTPIADAIITKAPSAELKPDQTDQDNLPPYDVLDGILYGLIEGEKSVDDLENEGFDRATVQTVYTLLTRSEYKRRQSPPGPKITSKALGRDRRYPLTNRF